MNRYTRYLLAAIAVSAIACGSAADAPRAVSSGLQVSRPMLIDGAGTGLTTNGDAALVENPDPAQQELLRQAVAEFAASSPMRVTTFKGDDGRLIDRIAIGGRPPEKFRMSPAATDPGVTGALGGVPTFDWCYGCSATSAAMMAGYYDRLDYADVYTGPTNGGVMPLTNSTWGAGECPLSATHMGIDGLSTRGHVDDYWIAYNSTATDPYITGGWAQHAHAACTADFMGTSQSTKDNPDGWTTFYNNTDGSPLYDYTGCEPAERDGGHGMRLFFESRGYTVNENFNQYIYGYNGNTIGFTIDQYKAEIDAGRPVLIHVTDHTMLGYGYTAGTSTIQIHDTWDHSNHSMTWGGTYSGLQHYAVTVIRLAPACACSGVSACCDGCHFTTSPCNADSSGCTVGDACSRGVCVPGAAADCTGAGDQCNVGFCVSTGSSSYVCQTSSTPREGQSCDSDNNGCTSGDKCVSGTCVTGARVVCDAGTEQCRDRNCVSTGPSTHKCVWDPAPYEGLPCNADSSGCTVDDTCLSGVCTAGAAPDCSAVADQCNVGVCASTGLTTYVCQPSPGPKEGQSCNADNDGCTPGDKCQSGICSAGSFADCSALNDACNTGSCKSTGAASYTCQKDPAPKEGTLCDSDGNGCTVDDRCTAGHCVTGGNADCSAMGDQCNTGYCRSMGIHAFECLKDPSPWQGHACNADGSGCTKDDYCNAGSCLPGNQVDCAWRTDQCNTGYCHSTGTNTSECLRDPEPAEGARCNADGNGCTVDDTCMAGECVAGSMPNCAAADDQCNSGYCKSMNDNSYACLKNPAPHEGRSCDADGSGCTIDDTCRSGACVPGARPDCRGAGDQCNEGICGSTGVNSFDCVKNPKPREGYPCNADNDGCTRNDTCAGGVCLAGAPQDCGAAGDQCNAGYCASTGSDTFDCLRDPVPMDGVPCNSDDSGCTVGDSCLGGSCVQGPTERCYAAYDQCNSGYCESTGPYSMECRRNPAMFEGQWCNADDDGCTVDDTCTAGECVAGRVPDCSALDDVCNVGACASTGTASFQCRKDPGPRQGLACNADGDGCTVDDACAAGKCLAGRDSGCGALDNGCTAWGCDSTGVNSFVCAIDRVADDGAPCNADDDGCTADDSCAMGECLVGSVVDCATADDQCNTGYCNSTGPGGFECLKDPDPHEGAGCDADGSGCTVGDECMSGECLAGPAADCAGMDDQCNTGYCDSIAPDAWVCLKDPEPHEGNPCNADENGCTVGDACDAGECAAGAAADCTAMDDQCNTGICNPTGPDGFVCAKDPGPLEGAICDSDGDGCTVGDECLSGECLAGPAADCTGADDQCNTGYCASTGVDTFECLKDSTAFEGLTCDADGSGCTIGDSCGAGLCIAGAGADCSAMDDQCNTGFCVSTAADAYECMKDPATHEGAGCDADGDGCTVGDQCLTGSCIAGFAADCTGADDQCNTGRCKSTAADAYECQKDPVPLHGKRCNADNSGCTINDTCSTGKCVAGGRPNCAGMTDQCNTGFCASTDVNAYECRKNPAPQEGRACNADGDGCTVNDACASGTCVAGAPADCGYLDEPCVIGRCGSTGASTFACSADSESMEGLECDDDIACTVDESCVAGVCGGIPKVCDDAIACTADSCDAVTGNCVFATDDRACDDANACTTDTCSPDVGCESTDLADWSPCQDVGHACFTGACEPLMPNDTCPRAHELALDVPVHQEFAGYHAYRPISAACLADGAVGPDAYYALTTDPGVACTVTVTADDGTSLAAALLAGCGPDAGCLDAGRVDDGELTFNVPTGNGHGTSFIQVMLIAVDDGSTAGFTIVVTVADQPGDQATNDDAFENDVTDDAGFDDGPAPDNAAGDPGANDSVATDHGPIDTGVTGDATRDSELPDHVTADMATSDLAAVDDGNEGTDTAGGGSGCSAANGNMPPLPVALLAIVLTGFLIIGKIFRKKSRDFIA